MHGPHLAIKRSNSECLTISSRIYSPSPIKRASRIGANIARELFDIPPRIDEFEFEVDEEPLPTFIKAKSCIFRTMQDSSNEWSSESGFSGNCTSGELESPTRIGTKNPSSQDTIFEDVTVEIPCRTSNPIVFDSNFKRYDQVCRFSHYNLQSSGINASDL
jgi:hypothetical protein